MAGYEDVIADYRAAVALRVCSNGADVVHRAIGTHSGVLVNPDWADMRNEHAWANLRPDIDADMRDQGEQFLDDRQNDARG